MKLKTNVKAGSEEMSPKTMDTEKMMDDSALLDD